MACTMRNLSVLNYAQGFTSWHYRLIGPLADALAPGFFNPVSDMIEPGDSVHVSASDGGALLHVHTSGNTGVKVEPMCGTSTMHAAQAKAAA